MPRVQFVVIEDEVCDVRHPLSQSRSGLNETLIVPTESQITEVIDFCIAPRNLSTISNHLTVRGVLRTRFLSNRVSSVREVGTVSIERHTALQTSVIDNLSECSREGKLSVVDSIEQAHLIETGQSDERSVVRGIVYDVDTFL